jgi:hypothetical protein
VAEDLERWPEAGHAVVHELSVARGRIALIPGDAPAAADGLVEHLANDLGLTMVSLGQEFAESPAPPRAEEIERACADATVITDIDMVFWPELRVSVLPFLRHRGKLRATIAVWPGEIRGGRAIYSAPGRPDHHDSYLRDVMVLRPRDTRFPDEVPFELERILP